MMQVVQIQCPRCQKVLRAPAEWAAQPMRCKHCKQVFQSRAAQSVQQAAATVVASDTRLSGNLFEDLEGQSTSPAPRRRGTGLLKKVVGAFMLLALGAGLLFVGIKVAPYFQDTKVAKEDKGYYPDETVKKKKKDENSYPKLDPSKKENPPFEKKNPESKKDDPPKKPKDDPKQKDPEKKKDPEKVLVAKVDPFPRALLINVNDYLFWNPVSYGSPRQAPYPGSSIKAWANLMTGEKRLGLKPFQINGDQITELSDGEPESVKNGLSRQIVPPWKQVIENTLLDFLKSSRAQDRIIVLFAGHAIEIEKKSYLIPLEGKKEDLDTLIPLSWVYEQLAKCPARQKVLILDICRYPPAQGLERPAPDEMSEDMDKTLQEPPAGVQVWSSCIKGQKSIELEKGSVFLQALCSATLEGVAGFQEVDDPLPIEQLVPKVNQRLEKILGPQKLQQISRLIGKEADGGAAYNRSEPMPERIVIQRPKVDGGEAAATAEVDAIRKEIALLPSTRAQQSPLRFFPPVSEKVIANYKADYASWDEVKKEADKKPLRKAILDAIDVMKEHNLVLQERLNNPGGGVFDGKAKAAFLLKQKEPAIISFYLDRALKELEEAGKDRDGETKRFQAHYDFTLARLRSRLIYVYEYDFLLGQIRADNLPPLEPIHNGWRLGSKNEVSVTKKEGRIKTMVKDADKAWKRIIADYAGTPWAVLVAAREKMTALGLEWRPTRD